MYKLKKIHALEERIWVNGLRNKLEQENKINPQGREKLKRPITKCEAIFAKHLFEKDYRLNHVKNLLFTCTEIKNLRKNRKMTQILHQRKYKHME